MIPNFTKPKSMCLSWQSLVSNSIIYQIFLVIVFTWIWGAVSQSSVVFHGIAFSVRGMENRAINCEAAIRGHLTGRELLEVGQPRRFLNRICHCCCTPIAILEKRQIWFDKIFFRLFDIFFFSCFLSFLLSL